MIKNIMLLVNLVPLVLLVGVLTTESAVDAAKHLREQPNNLRETIVSFFDTFVEYSINHDTDALINLHHEKVRVMMDGFPPFVLHDEIRTLAELVPEKAADIKCTYKEVQPMDEGAHYLYAVLHIEYFNDSGEKYLAANGVFIFIKTGDGYKLYMVMFNKHNQAAQ